MRHFLNAQCILLLAWSNAAVAQDLPANISDSLTSASSVSSAAQTLGKAAGDALLIKDLIGKTLTGADGNSVGTIENFAVVPGGRIIAALVSTDDGTKIAVPYGAVKVTNAAGTANLSANIPASELRGMSDLESLAGSLAD